MGGRPGNDGTFTIGVAKDNEAAMIQHCESMKQGKFPIETKKCLWM
eukprot:UN27183